MKKERRKFSTEFKKKVVLDSLKESKTTEELSKQYDIHPSMVNSWKSEVVSKLDLLFGKEKPSETISEKELEKLYARIGQLNMEVEFLKKRV